MENIKNVKKIPFTHPFMFSLVMRNEEICLGLLRLILPEEDFVEVRIIPETDSPSDSKAENNKSETLISTEAALKFAASSHGIRFDAFAKSKNVWAEIEMQTYTGTNIAKRSRYYQANMDIEALNQGKDYDELPRSYVIFICTYDYKEKGEPIYYFQNYDIKNDLRFGDESYKIILNTKCEPEKVPKELRPLFDYIQNRVNDPKEELISRIENEVVKYNGDDWRRKFMTLAEVMRWERDEGRTEGHEAGLSEGRREGSLNTLAKLYEQGVITIEKACEEAGLSQEEFLSLMNGAGSL